MNKIEQEVLKYTDMYPWFWLSYGEKCYAFAVASAYPVDDNILEPKGGGELTPHMEKEYVYLTNDNVEMYVDEFIFTNESQSGDKLCALVAQLYTLWRQKAFEILEVREE